MLIRFLERLFAAYRCGFRESTGLYCPGCGGLRASLALMKGDVAGSFHFHPLVPYVAFAVLLTLCLYLQYFFSKRWKPGFPYFFTLVCSGLVLILVQFFWKNYCLLYKGIELLY